MCAGHVGGKLLLGLLEPIYTDLSPFGVNYDHLGTFEFLHNC